MVTFGDAVRFCVVCPPGVHTYVPPGKDGVAVKVALIPLQTVSFTMVTVGTGFTVTVPVAGAF